MVLIFDLDDTLYEERTYVASGFRAVAFWGQERYGWDPNHSFVSLISVLEAEGRGTVFNRWLESNGIRSKKAIKECVKVYRHHIPNISVPEEIKKLLASFFDFPLYLVTDGHKIVQANKIDALGIAHFFRRCYITHRYGVACAKPSLRCFELIKAKEGCSWKEMVYIGDNPAKDFVGLNFVGAHTIRVKTGMYQNTVAKHGYEAQHAIADILHLPSIIATL